MININKGHNPDLLDKCETLNDYATLINKIREFKEIYESIEIAVTKAVDWCIENDILSEYLRMHKSEVIGMVLTEYNQKEIMDDIRSEAFEDGRLSEIANTEKERKRANDAEVRADAAESRADAAEERLSQANTYIKELEQKLADLNIASTK